MKKKLFFSGIISILLIFTFMAGCDNGSTTTEYLPGPTQYVPSPVPGPETTKEVPVPGDNFNVLSKTLIDEGEKALAETDPTVVHKVVITGQIPVKGNDVLIVPAGVVLEIAKGGRLVLEANSMFFVRETAKVIVKGDIHFEKYSNWDDVREAKVIGDIELDGGVFYDKTDDGAKFQYVTKIMNGGRMKYSGGTAIGAAHEKYLLGTATFSGSGYIKMIYSQGWSKSNLVVPDTTAGADETFLTHLAATAHSVSTLYSPELAGFEVVGEVTLTGGELVLPDARATGSHPLAFKVGEGAKLTIAQGAVLKAEDVNTTAGTDVTKFVVADRATVEVAGQLWIPIELGTPGTEAVTSNSGTITVTETGTLQNDDVTANVTDDKLFPQNKGTVVIKGGGKAVYDRAQYPAQPVYIGTGASAERYKTSAKTDITITSDLLKISGAGAVTVIPASYTQEIPVQVDDKADVTVNGVWTGGSAPANGITLTKNAKLTFKGVPASVAKLTATGGSEVIFHGATAVGTAVITAIELTESTATYYQVAGATPVTSLIPGGVTASKATINLKGGPAITALNVGTVVIGGPEIAKFTVDSAAVTLGTSPLTIAGGGVAEFGGNLTIAALNVNLSAKGSLKVGGLLTAAAGTVTLNDSTATLNNVTTAATSTAVAFGLSGGSVVTVAGTATFTGAAPLITLQDAASKLTGTTAGVSKLTMTTGSGPLVYTTADNTSFKALFEPVTTGTADTDTTVVRNIAVNTAVIWNGTKWGVPQ